MEKIKFTKAEICENISGKLGLDKKIVQNILDDFFEEIKKALSENKIVELRNFGTFEVRIRKAKAKARNPKTGESITKESHGVALFRAGRELKKLVWPVKNTNQE